MSLCLCGEKYMSFSVKIAVPSDTRYLAPLRQLMSASARLVGRRGFPKVALRSCTLALIEAVDNAIFHAHHHSKNKWIEVHLDVKKDSIVIRVKDHGRGLNHIEVKNPGLTATRGRGLYLMEHLMDSVESKTSGKRHEMILTYKL